MKTSVDLLLSPSSGLLSLHRSILILWLDLKFIVWLPCLNFWACSLMRWKDFLESPQSILTWTFNSSSIFKWENENGTIRDSLLTRGKRWWMRQWIIITQCLKQKPLPNKFSINSEATLADNLKNLHIFGSIRISASNYMKRPQYLYLSNYCLG